MKRKPIGINIGPKITPGSLIGRAKRGPKPPDGGRVRVTANLSSEHVARLISITRSGSATKRFEQIIDELHAIRAKRSIGEGI